MALRRLEFHPAALAEAVSARQWYAARSTWAGGAFIAEVDAAIREIRTHPRQWPRHRHGTRRPVLSRFPFVVVYREYPALIRIIAVAHARRRPDYWARRR